jgi:hypothetical protein
MEMETWKNGEMEKWRLGDVATRRYGHGDVETSQMLNGKRKPR